MRPEAGNWRGEKRWIVLHVSGAASRSTRRSPRSYSYRPPLRRTRASTSRRSSGARPRPGTLLVADAGQGIVNGDTGALVAPLLGVTDVAVRSGGGLWATTGAEDPEEDTGQGIWRISGGSATLVANLFEYERRSIRIQRRSTRTRSTSRTPVAGRHSSPTREATASSSSGTATRRTATW